MFSSIRMIRTLIQILVGISIVLFIYFAGRVLEDLRDLSSAENDNIQWTVSQSEVELIKLQRLFDRHLFENPTSSISELQLRADIFLTRLNVMVDGRIAEIVKGDAAANQLLTDIAYYRDGFQLASEDLQALPQADLIRLANSLESVQDDLRSFSLQIVGVLAQMERQERERFQSLLRLAVGIGCLVLASICALLLVLQGMLISARRKDEQLTRSSDRLTSTVAASLDAIITSDIAGRVIGFNEAAERILGWTKDEMIGALYARHLCALPTSRSSCHWNGSACEDGREARCRWRSYGTYSTAKIWRGISDRTEHQIR